MNVTLNANSFFFDADFELEAGVIDEDAKHVFVSGQCHSLALALHEATDWPLVGVFHPRWGDEDVPGHVGVQLPTGYVLDITGLTSERDWCAKWNGWFDTVDADDARTGFVRWVEDEEDDLPLYRIPEVEIASHWVRPVLREYVPVSQWPSALVTA